MSQHDSPRRMALRDAAHLLRLTADDFEGMAARQQTFAQAQTLLGKRQQANAHAQCLKEKAELLRGQANKIEAL